MKTLCLLILLLLGACASITHITKSPQTQAATPPVPSDEPLLVFFTSEPGNFNVWLPVSGGIQDYTVTKTLFTQPVDCVVLNSSLNSAYATIQYCDLPFESILSLSTDEVFRHSRDELARDLRLKFDTEQKILIENSYPTVLLTGQANMRGVGYDGVFKARMILAENRIYLVIMTVYSINWCNCLHQIDQVVDSFYIDPNLSIPFEPTP